MRCAVLREIGDRFRGEVSIGDQVSRGQQRSAVRWRTFIVRQRESEGNR